MNTVSPVDIISRRAFVGGMGLAALGAVANAAAPSTSAPRVTGVKAAVDTVSTSNTLDQAFAKLDELVQQTNQNLRGSEEDTPVNQKKFHADLKSAQDKLLAAWSKQGIPENKSETYYSILDRYCSLTTVLQKRYDRSMFKEPGISFTDLKKDFSVQALKYSSDNVTKLRLATFNPEYQQTSKDQPSEKEVISYWAKYPRILAGSEKARVIVSIDGLLKAKKVDKKDQERFIQGLYAHFADTVGSYRSLSAKVEPASKRNAQLYFRELREDMASVLPEIHSHKSDFISNLGYMGIKPVTKFSMNAQRTGGFDIFTGAIEVLGEPITNMVALISPTVKDWRAKAFPLDSKPSVATTVPAK